MPREIVRTAILEAEQASPDIRAAVRLRGARVLQRFDATEARRLVDEAVDLVSSLTDDTIAEPMRFITAPIVATVAPSLAIQLLTDGRWTFGVIGPPIDQSLHNMIEHGHRAKAIAYLLSPDLRLPYPFTVAMTVARDEDTQRAMLRAAIDAARREHAPGGARRLGGSFGDHHFQFMFSRQWRSLPAEEARAAVRDIAARMLAAPDQRTAGGFGGSPDQPRFSSSREQQLYGILSPLQHLDPEYTRALLADYPQLAKAAARYPFGEESMIREMESRVPTPPPEARPPAEPVEYDIYFESGAISPTEAVATAFAEPFAFADRAFAADDDPVKGNAAPIECWPSTSQYRTILYYAGVHEGRDGVRHLARVPSDDIRRLAAIELAAGLAGLPRIGDLTRGPGGRRRGAVASRMAGQGPPPNFRIPAPVEPLPPARRPHRTPSLEAEIAPTAKAPGDRLAGGCGSDFWTIEGAPLEPVIARLWNVPEDRVDMPVRLVDGRYDFSLVLPDDRTQEEMRRLMRSGIEKHFGLAIVTELRSMDVMVMTAPDGLRAPAVPMKHGGRLHAGSISWSTRFDGLDPTLAEALSPEAMFDALARDHAETRLAGDLDAVFDMSLAARQTPQTLEDYMQEMSGRISRFSAGRNAVLTGIRQEMSMAELCNVLMSALGKPFIDETELRGEYTLDVETEAPTSEAFLDALATHTGLVFTPARRNIPVVVVRGK